MINFTLLNPQYKSNQEAPRVYCKMKGREFEDPRLFETKDGNANCLLNSRVHVVIIFCKP